MARDAPLISHLLMYERIFLSSPSSSANSDESFARISFSITLAGAIGAGWGRGFRITIAAVAIMAMANAAMIMAVFFFIGLQKAGFLSIIYNEVCSSFDSKPAGVYA